MANKTHGNSTPRSARSVKRLSLAPLRPDDALRAALQVKPTDLAKLEAQEAKAKKRRKK